MDVIYVADAPALLNIADLAAQYDIEDFWDGLTLLVEKSTLRFPRAVVEDLKVRARDEQVASWGAALGRVLRGFSAEDENTSWLMRRLQIDFGYEEGLEDLDGKEPSIVAVAAYVRQLVSTGCTVRVFTEDRGDVPLRPTMEQLCQSFEWTSCGATEFLVAHGFIES